MNQPSATPDSNLPQYHVPRGTLFSPGAAEMVCDGGTKIIAVRFRTSQDNRGPACRIINRQKKGDPITVLITCPVPFTSATLCLSDTHQGILQTLGACRLGTAKTSGELLVTRHDPFDTDLLALFLELAPPAAPTKSAA